MLPSSLRCSSNRHRQKQQQQHLRSSSHHCNNNTSNNNTSNNNHNSCGFYTRIWILSLLVACLFVDLVNADDESPFIFFSFAAEPHDVVAFREQPSYLHCAPSLQALGAEWTVTWRRNDQTLNIAASAGRLHVFENGTLRVNVGKAGGSFDQDAGVYQCAVQVKHAAHSWTFVSKKAKLTVAVLPRFEEQPRDQSVVVGSAILLPCRVSDAAPQPSVQWYKDNVPLDVEQEPRFTIIQLTNSLEIRDAQYGDSATYKCRLSIPDKYRYSTDATITVVKLNEQDDLSEPQFVATPRGRVVKVEESAVLECLANGQPKPEITWLKDGRKIDMDATHAIVGSSHLYMSAVSADDTGTYTCRATNAHESVDTNAALEVIVPPAITKPPKDAVMNETHDVEFLCDTNGRPGPAVTWYKNGETIIPSDYFRIESDRLRVLGLVRGDTGVYQCLAENGAGSIQASAQLMVEMADANLSSSTVEGQPVTTASSGTDSDGLEGLAMSTMPTVDTKLVNMLTPDPSSAATAEVTANYDMILSNVPTEPRNLRAVTVASRHVELIWDEPLQTQGGVKLYHVFYKRTGSQRERVTNTTTTRITIKRLEPAAEYDFRVLAISRSGRGITSPALTIATIAEQEVPGSVANVALDVLSPTSIKVTWSRPAEDDTFIKFYKLFYVCTDESVSGRDAEIEIQISSTATEYTLHGLEKYTQYSVRMEAHGDNGPGPSSMSVDGRTLGDVPSAAPNDFAVDASGTKSILVTWQPPPGRAQNGVITGYKIRWKASPRRRGVRPQSFTVDGDHLKYEITSDITPASTYDVKVQAINAYGSGPYTEWKKVTTFAKEREEDQVPGAPQSLRPQADSTSIALTWSPPLDDGIMVRGYVVGWGVGIPDLNTKRLGANQRYFKIENLDSSREYVISVRAYNHAGNGFPMYESVRTASPSAVLPSMHGHDDDDDYDYENIDGAPLPTPVYVRAITLSSVAIQLTWTDRDLSDESFAPQRPLDGRLYNIRYTDHANGQRGYQFINATETAFVIDHLRPNTQYEFAVRIMLGARTSSWSMHALNKTDIAPPTSAPRDFTASPSPDNNPLAVMLSWQPPRFSNGPIVEYLLYHSTDPSLPIVDWKYDALRGDRLMYTVGELLPQTTYYFKVQARNDRGFGPISNEKQYRTGGGGASGGPIGGPPAQADGNAEKPSIEKAMHDLIDKHNKDSNMFFYIVIGALSTVVLIVILSVFAWCCFRQHGRRRRDGYVAGKPTEVKPPPDLWIDHKHVDHGRHNDDHNTPPESMHDFKQAVYSANNGEEPHHAYHSLAGTLSRSYHHQSSGSSVDLVQSHSARQRTPQTIYESPNGLQVVYTGPRNHQQPTVSIDGNVSGRHHSPYQSTAALGITPTPPPQVPADGTRTLGKRQVSTGGHPLTSFAGVAAPPPPPPAPPTSSSPRTHIVRPVVASSPVRSVSTGHRPPVTTVVKTATVLPNTRAPSSQTSPLANSDTTSDNTYASTAHAHTLNGLDSSKDKSDLHHSYSTEELNAQMQNLDVMIDDLQAMQAEFSNIV